MDLLPLIIINLTVTEMRVYKLFVSALLSFNQIFEQDIK